MEKKRLLILDTETTGLNFDEDKIIEIGIVELSENILTPNCFHEYINPEMEISLSAQKIHGINNDFLMHKPNFSQIAEKFLNFIKNDTIIIHNAEFDTRFINKELQDCGFSNLNNHIIDTINIARKEFPGQTVNLDSLCRKLNVVNTRNDYHGALLDATLLSKVYIRLTTGKQENLDFTNKKSLVIKNQNDDINFRNNPLFPRHKLMRLSDNEKEQHNKFITGMKDPIWKK